LHKKLVKTPLSRNPQNNRKIPSLVNGLMRRREAEHYKGRDCRVLKSAALCTAEKTRKKDLANQKGAGKSY
jgi:hypothetical protein